MRLGPFADQFNDSLVIHTSGPCEHRRYHRYAHTDPVVSNNRQHQSVDQYGSTDRPPG